MRVAAIVPSAGSGSRLNSSVPKPYIKIGRKPILGRTLTALSKNKKIREILVAVGKGRLDKTRREIIERYKIKKVRLVIGGSERGDSVYNALKSVSKDIDYVLIHDGIRPFINNRLIESVLKEARRSGAAILAVPVKPTLKVSRKNGFIEATPERRLFWEAQTPQVFKKGLIEKAYEFSRKNNIRATDDSALVERLGARPRIVMGSYSNIKITTREDLELAKILLKKRLVIQRQYACRHRL